MASQKPGPIFRTEIYKLKMCIYFILHYTSIIKVSVFLRSKDHRFETHETYFFRAENLWNILLPQQKEKCG